ncbi:hypothetical protein [Variovorax sp. OV084]|uniref:hypothetical protein n=1 Tax=Variovorax sp. OV084 TaxID=1882777 RepID=UPI00115FE5E7|nr:hypothetical protein [Variovorax sp. OV084]
MINELPHVPPSVWLLLDAVGPAAKTWSNARKRVKEMLPDLRMQSEVYQAESFSERFQAAPTEFDIYLDGPLDLFSPRSCRNPECRSAQAQRLMRSMGLLADRVWLTDHLTERFVRFGRATNAKLDDAVLDGLLLWELFPMIAAGIIKFRSPIVPACPSCIEHFDDVVGATAATLLDEFADQVVVRRPGDGTCVVDTGSFYEPQTSMFAFEKDFDSSLSQRDVAEQQITMAVHSALWTARDAAAGGGAVFSNSRIGLFGLLRQEGRVVVGHQLRLLDNARDLQLPWVSDLNAHQILQLREEASKALPRFRELIASALNVNPQKTSVSSPSEVVTELREQATELRSELELVERHALRYWKSGYALLGLGLSAYGVATDQVMPAVAGLLPVLQLLMNHKAGHEKDADALTRRPGYVLVKAQDLLAHAH